MERRWGGGGGGQWQKTVTRISHVSQKHELCDKKDKKKKMSSVIPCGPATYMYQAAPLQSQLQRPLTSAV